MVIFFLPFAIGSIALTVQETWSRMRRRPVKRTDGVLAKPVAQALARARISAKRSTRWPASSRPASRVQCNHNHRFRNTNAINTSKSRYTAFLLHVMANPWITLTSPTEAHGRWTLMDFLTQRSAQLHSGTAGGPAQPLLWLALYEDDYRKVNGRWLIAHVKLHFLWPSSSFAELRHALVERPPQA